jgi:hypothetical protein
MQGSSALTPGGGSLPRCPRRRAPEVPAGGPCASPAGGDGPPGRRGIPPLPAAAPRYPPPGDVSGTRDVRGDDAGRSRCPTPPEGRGIPPVPVRRRNRPGRGACNPLLRAARAQAAARATVGRTRGGNRGAEPPWNGECVCRPPAADRFPAVDGGTGWLAGRTGKDPACPAWVMAAACAGIEGVAPREASNGRPLDGNRSALTDVRPLTESVLEGGRTTGGRRACRRGAADGPAAMKAGADGQGR